ncbi:MAG: hypothetical protein IPM69_07915 [Ignavibacteria bacterium]|nr:hypothetical protein [Ignavibacteria bacterium]
MAETLGSLVDKLAIVDLKLWHCQEQLFKPHEEPQPPIIQKNESLLGQRERLIREIDTWFYAAVTDPESVILTNPQNKIYGQYRKE